jgi:hypothetical protein
VKNLFQILVQRRMLASVQDRRVRSSAATLLL